ncbi:hypothetical protein BEP19_12810 [Ammoniphilus oxalaticus]|uniref:Tyrosine-protein phosphatase n=1 Tax=Ammoniphilus oxalaticus TaxID=66863 RepID=A0A419SH36_9BACL|nr:CpsB/CapC family capsule biosynthesis tyrosine phosphatase [Ammoniphilus oxalaticus]RKD23099.1 hypothetical protein BEP19_12810 [Ammoniphilus oxalaticus]
MIDIHSHILYGLDDGAQTKEDTLAMARQAVEDGITVIVATPHHNDGQHDNSPARIIERCNQVQALLDEHQIPIRVLPGMEMRVKGDEVVALEMKQLLTYNDLQRHILLELPHDHVPRYVDQLIFDLQLAGYVPIIAHPERNREIGRDLNILYRMVKRGALAQLTAASVSGKFGKKYQGISFSMIKHHMVHFVATDAHNTGKRGVQLSEAYQVIDRKFGPEYSLMYQEFALKVTKGLDCPVPPVEKIRKKLFGIF